MLAAISPAAILVCDTYLGSASPRRTTLWFLAGATIMTAVIGVIALASAAALATVVIISVMFVWPPFAFHLVRPEATARRLKAFNGWLRAHGHALVAGPSWPPASCSSRTASPAWPDRGAQGGGASGWCGHQPMR